jgi:peroxiredoxin
MRTSAIAGALLFSVALNVVLTVRAGQQRALIDEIRTQYKPLLGQTVPAFTARDAAGVETAIAYGGDLPTVLYVFSPGCGACTKNAEAIGALAAGASSHYRFVGVSLDRRGLAAYLADHPLPFPVVTDLDPSTVSAYRFGGTPQTIVVSTSGTVLDTWLGAFQADQKTQIERFFGVSLPEVAAYKE